ncbi:hypothetical protein BH11ACT2_BH11ACT2_16810 [soil metagenome]
MTFNSSVAGTAADAWDELLESARRFELDGFTELLVIAAHPDDETLGTAGLIGACADRGLPVRVVVVTDGAASHPHSPTHTPQALAVLRANETARALAILAPGATCEFLGYPDGQTRERADEIERALRDEIAATAATALIAVPWQGDGHRDHRVVSERAAAVVGGQTLVEYPIWMWHWADAHDERVPTLSALPIDATRKAKAIAAHATQIAPLSARTGDEAMLSPEFVEHFRRGVEVFIESDSMREGYFDALYARRDDPWYLATRWYEERKRAVTMASLPRRRFGRTLEIGSSIGMLTELLRDRSDDLVSIDIAAAAVEATRSRVGDTVTVLQTDAAAGLPDGQYDLIVVSEIGYYLTVDALARLVADIVAHLAPGATVVACHWRHPTDYLQTGDAVHAGIAENIGLARIASHLEPDFVLDVYSADPRSVAAREGLA